VRSRVILEGQGRIQLKEDVMSQKVKVKKPIYKRTWFIVLVVLFVFGRIAGGGTDEVPVSTDVPVAVAAESIEDVASDSDAEIQVVTPDDELTDKQDEVRKIEADFEYDEIQVVFIDVGQADAILIVEGEDAMLIDAGNNNDAALVLSYLESYSVNKLDYVIGTHPHEDHIGGLDVIIDSLDIEQVFMPKVINTTKTFEDVLDAVDRKDLRITTPKVGATYALGQATWEIVAPNSDSYDDLNDYSIVIKLSYGSQEFLFTGDAETLSEREILQAGADISADVFKVGHHGSSSSTTQGFLEAVDPDYAIICVGEDNSYGHPDDEVLARLSAMGVKVYRTDINGTVVATSDGTSIMFTQEKEPAPVVSVPEPPAEPETVELDEPETSTAVISALDKRYESVTIKNPTGSTIDLSGWRVVSVKGNQCYTIPSGTTLAAGDTLTIASGGGTGDLIWTKSNMWNNSDPDPAELYDAHGNLVSKFGR
jgi:beta-lactamase superfamily II metal-dependent hydrolase